jgi:hypothetical protein
MFHLFQPRHRLGRRHYCDAQRRVGTRKCCDSMDWASQRDRLGSGFPAYSRLSFLQCPQPSPFATATAIECVAGRLSWIGPFAILAVSQGAKGPRAPAAGPQQARRPRIPAMSQESQAPQVPAMSQESQAPGIQAPAMSQESQAPGTQSPAVSPQAPQPPGTHVLAIPHQQAAKASQASAGTHVPDQQSTDYGQCVL